MHRDFGGYFYRKKSAYYTRVNTALWVYLDESWKDSYFTWFTVTTRLAPNGTKSLLFQLSLNSNTDAVR